MIRLNKRILMSRLVCRWMLVLAMLVAMPNAMAAFDQGLLWKIETAGVAPSYIFGTYHTEDSRVTHLPEVVQSRFIAASSLSTEITMDPVQMQQSSTRLFLAAGKRLSALLDPQLFRDTVQALAKRGIPPELVDKLKPWGAFTVLSTPPSKTGEMLDKMLYGRAVAMTKPAYGLETMGEQLDLFDTMRMEDQISMLRDAVKDFDQFDKNLEKMTDLYLKRDLAGLQRLSDQDLPDDADQAERFMERLVYARNRTMVERMQPRLQEGNAFIAIGALHLPGDKGVLQLLQQRGFRVSPVY